MEAKSFVLFFCLFFSLEFARAVNVPLASDEPVVSAAESTSEDTPIEEPKAEKKLSYRERLKEQKTAQVFYLAMPNPRGKIVAEFYNQYGQRTYTAMASSVSARYFQIEFQPIIKETNPIKIYTYVKEKLEFINKALDLNVSVSEYEALTYFENRRWLPLRVGSLLSKDNLKKLKGIKLPLGLSYLEIPARYYANGYRAGHLLGAVKRTESWPLRGIKKNESLFPQIEGITGLEKTQNDTLSGQSTVFEYKYNEEGELQVPLKVIKKGRPGLDVVMTMDVEMQRIAESILKEQTAKSKTGKGAIVVIDVENMEIKAAASWPVIDPNDYFPVLTTTVLNKWKNNPNKPTIARAFESAYPPASVFKLVTSMIGLSSRLIGPSDQSYQCLNSKTYNGVKMNNWMKEPGEPFMNVYTALKRSCNTWFFQMANEMQGRGKGFYNWFHSIVPQLGLGLNTGLEINGEASGYAYEKDGVKKDFYQGAQVSNISIGQGDLAVTPLQMAQMLARLANPNTSTKAHLVRSAQGEDGGYPRSDKSYFKSGTLRGYQTAIDHIKLGMYDVVYGDNGTGTAARGANFTVIGKTGTAQWGGDKNVAWFGSMAPYFNNVDPKYVVVSMQEGNPGQELSGGADAAPMVGKFFNNPYVSARVESYLSQYGIVRSTEEIPEALPVERGY